MKVSNDCTYPNDIDCVQHNFIYYFFYFSFNAQLISRFGLLQCFIHWGIYNFKRNGFGGKTGSLNVIKKRMKKKKKMGKKKRDLEKTSHKVRTKNPFLFFNVSLVRIYVV